MIVDFHKIQEIVGHPSYRMVVHCHGVFDILHIGHLRMLKKAAELGDTLVVSITADDHVGKGPGRPVYGERFRAEMLDGLECVDFVVVVPFPSGKEIIEKIRADIYAKGAQYEGTETPALLEEKETCRKQGTKFEYVYDPVISSSTELVKHVGDWPKEVVEAMDGIKKEHGFDGVVAWLDKARKQSVAVMGEAIIDEYVQCEVLGRSSKSHLAALRRVQEKRYAGGSVAVAKVLEGFCDDVFLLALTGVDEGRDWLRSQVGEMDHIFVGRCDGPTVLKRRYWERYYGLPMCEVYEMTDHYLQPIDEQKLAREAGIKAKTADVTIVTDYGHGMFTPSIISEIGRSVNYLALNVQQNAGNQGLSKFQKWGCGADCLTMALAEFWLSRGERIDSERLIQQGICLMANDMKSGRVVVTRGRDGCLAYNRDDGGFLTFPSIAFEVKDRVGAGDVFLSFFSLFSACSAPLDVSLFVSSAAAAFAVSRMGPGGGFITRESLLRHIKGLLS